MTLCISIKCHHAEYHYAECRVWHIVILNVIMLSVVMLSAIMLNVIMLSVIMLSAIMLNVIMMYNHIVRHQQKLYLAFALPTNIKLGWKILPLKNTLAYFAIASVMNEKSFIMST